MAVGAAVACPDRKIINLQADGSCMYTLQALWTQAREQLDVVTIICANNTYAILKVSKMQTVYQYHIKIKIFHLACSFDINSICRFIQLPTAAAQLVKSDSFVLSASFLIYVLKESLSDENLSHQTI